MTATRSTHHDVVVVGSRCAGAATALLLSQAGHDVVLVDRAAQPSDTLSTHGIARGGVVQLSRWGLLDAVLASGAPPARQVTFGIDGAQTVRTINDRAGVDMLIAPRRHVLDALLTDAARDAGADARMGLTAAGVLRDSSGRVTGITTRDRLGGTAELTGRYIIGADGLHSTIARFVGAEILESFTSDAGLFYAYVASPLWNGFEFHLAPSSLIGVFPTHDGEACVWLSRPAPLLQDISRADPSVPRRCSPYSPVSRRPWASGPETDASPHRSAASPGCPTTCAAATVRDGRWPATPATTATRSPDTA